MEDKYDSALLGIIQSEGKIEPFLHAILGFLYRRTDFFRIMKSKEDKIGFPPGVALRMLTGVFKWYDDNARKSEAMIEKKKKAEVIKPKCDPVKSDAVSKSNSVKVDSVSSQAKAGCNSSSKPCDTSNPSKDKTVPTKQQCDLSSKLEPDSAHISCDHGSLDTNKELPKTSETVGATIPKQGTGSETHSASKTTDPKNGEEDDNPELTRQQKEFQSNPDSYNGAMRDNYSWSQSITDLDLKVKVPVYVKKGREVKVDIGKKHIKVQHKDQSGQWCVVVDGDLIWEVRKEDSMWSLDPGDNVHVNFEKKEERWWEAMMVDEPKISVRKIDASRPMTDLDDEAQGKIEEMMYNDRQKKLGLPQSHEQKMHGMLRNAWDAEGSPFKGQEFDPSKFNVDPNGMMTMKPT